VSKGIITGRANLLETVQRAASAVGKRATLILEDAV